MIPDDSSQTSDEHLLRSAADQVRDDVLSGLSQPVERALRSHQSFGGQAEPAMDLIYAEFLAREETGQTPQAAEYVRRFPDWAERIERLFEVHEAFLETESTDTFATRGFQEESTIPGQTDVSDRQLSETPDPAHPRRLGQYTLLEEIGNGATGVVFRASQSGLDRTVAVKILKPFGTEDSRRRFQAEAELTARLRHQNIVQIYEVGQDSGCDFMSMEILEAGSLATMLAHTAFTAQAAAELVRTLADAITAAHAQKILHRDLKPGNVLLDRDGTPRISDFGLARSLSEGEIRQTHRGAILGTPGYMAPEQADGSFDAGPPADIYSLGAILYELLTGRPPYHGTSVVEILEQMRFADPAPVCQLRRGVPRDLQTICMRCLERNPEQRYARAADLREDLNRYLNDQPILARPISDMERCWRWTMRRKAVAMLTGLSLIVAVAGTCGVFWQWSRAEDGLAEAKASAQVARLARQNEQTQRLLSEDRLYRRQVLAAHRELQSGALLAGKRILDECDARQRGWEWDYLISLSQSACLVLDGHESWVATVGFSSDGRMVAATSGSYAATPAGDSVDSESQADDKTSMRPNNRSRYRFDVVASRRVAEDDFTSMGKSKTIMWDVGSGQKLWEYAPERTGISQAFSPDGQQLLIAGLGTATLHDAMTGDIVKRLPVSEASSSWGAAFSPDGSCVAVTDGNRVSIFRTDPTDPSVIKCVGYMTPRDVRAISYHPDGDRLAVASKFVVLIHDCHTGKLLETLSMPADVRFVQFSPDGALLVASGHSLRDEGCLRVWEHTADSYKILHTRYDGTGARTGFRFSPDGQTIAVWNGTGPVRLLSPVTLREYASYSAHDYTRNVAFGPNSRTLVTCGAEHLVRLWDRTRESRNYLARSDLAYATDFAIHPTQSHVAVAADKNPFRVSAKLTNAVQVLDFDRWWWVRQLPEHSRVVSCVTYDSSGRLIASGSDDGTIHIGADSATARVQTIASHDAAVVGVHFTGRDTDATADEETTARLVSVDRSGLILIHRLEQQQAAATSPSGSAKGHSGPDAEPRYFRPAVTISEPTETTGARQRIPTGINGIRHTVLAGEQLGLASMVRGACVVNLNTGDVTGLGEDRACQCIAFDSSADRICTAGEDGTVRMWKRNASGAVAPVWSNVVHNGVVLSVAFHPAGNRVVSSGDDGLIRILDAGNGQELLVLKTDSYPSAVHRAQFDSDGRRLIATTRSRICVWDTQPRAWFQSGQAPDDPVARESIAAWYADQARRCEAGQNWLGAAMHWKQLGLHDRLHGWCHVFAARCHEKLQDWVTARRYYRTAVRTAAPHIDVNSGWHTLYGRACHDYAVLLATCPDHSQRFGLEAFRLACLALSTDPQRPEYWNTLRVALNEILRRKSGMLSQAQN
jgi:eukaryotic-like serine/threonine-protein kinase